MNTIGYFYFNIYNILSNTEEILKKKEKKMGMF